MGKKRLSKRAANIVIDQLGWSVDNLHRIARDWQGDSDSPERLAYREAADFVSDFRKKVQRNG